jgi:hypothetical protein
MPRAEDGKQQKANPRVRLQSRAPLDRDCDAGWDDENAEGPPAWISLYGCGAPACARMDRLSAKRQAPAFCLEGLADNSSREADFSLPKASVKAEVRHHKEGELQVDGSFNLGANLCFILPPQLS